MTTFRELKTGDVILCPTTGQEETVVVKRRQGQGTVWVRTSHHDHVKAGACPVQVRS